MKKTILLGQNDSNIIKFPILLKLVYTFNAIEFFIFYNQFYKLIKKFIWNNKKERIARKRTKIENRTSAS